MAGSASKRGKKDIPCGTCDEDCTLGTGLLCTFCETWFHTRCLSMPADVTKMLDQLAKVIAGPAFLCTICRKVIPKINKSFKDFESRLARVETEVDRLKIENALLTEKIEKNQNKTEQVREGIVRVEKDVEKQMEKTVTEVEEKMKKEMGERNERSENLVVYGLKEAADSTPDQGKADDLVKVIEMASQIDVAVDDDVEVRWRAGRKEEGKVRPLIIKVAKPETRTKMLANARFLRRREGWERVYIDQDLTKKQREEGKMEEERLKREAEERNAPKIREAGEEEEEQGEGGGKWIVVGRRGKQRLVREQERTRQERREN